MSGFLRAVVHAGALAFGPAVALTRRLRYAQKFVVVGLVLIVPLVTVVLVYVGGQRADQVFATRERHGVEFVAPLTVLTAHLVSARHEVVLSVGDSRPDLGSDVSRIDSLDRRLGRTLGTSDAWQQLRRTIVTAGNTRGGVLSRVKAYDAAADALLAFIARLGDQSGLTLDPDLDSYYLMQLVQNELPLLLDTVGRVTDRASFADVHSLTADADAFIELGVYNGILTTAHRAIGRAARIVADTTANVEVRRVVLDHFEPAGRGDRRIRPAATGRRRQPAGRCCARQRSRQCPLGGDLPRNRRGNRAGQSPPDAHRTALRPRAVGSSSALVSPPRSRSTCSSGSTCRSRPLSAASSRLCTLSPRAI